SHPRRLLVHHTPSPFSHVFFFPSPGPPRSLHSFPTRRSSDLLQPMSAGTTATRSASSITPVSIVVFGNSLHTRESTRSRSRRFRSEEHTSELQSRFDLVCRLLLEKKKTVARSVPHTSGIRQTV